MTLRERTREALSKMALIFKTQQDGSVKRRIIVDLRSSGANSIALLRAADAIRDLRCLAESEPELWQENGCNWRRHGILGLVKLSADFSAPSLLHRPRGLAAPVALLILRSESGSAVVGQIVGGGSEDASRFAAVVPVQIPGILGLLTFGCYCVPQAKRGNVVVAAAYRVRLGATSDMARRRAESRGHMDWSRLQVALGRQTRCVGGASKDEQGHVQRIGEHVERKHGRRRRLRSLEGRVSWNRGCGAPPSTGGQHGQCSGQRRHEKGVEEQRHETSRGRVTVGCLLDDSFPERASTQGKSQSVAVQVYDSYKRFASERRHDLRRRTFFWRGGGVRGRLDCVVRCESGLRDRGYVVADQGGTPLCFAGRGGLEIPLACLRILSGPQRLCGRHVRYGRTCGHITDHEVLSGRVGSALGNHRHSRSWRPPRARLSTRRQVVLAEALDQVNQMSRSHIARKV